MQENFKGIRNDIGEKHIGQEFVYDATNVNNDSIVGVDSILYPERAMFTTTQQDKDFIAATIYTFETDTAKVDTNVTSNNVAIKDYVVESNYYSTGSTSTMSFENSDFNKLVVSFWADGLSGVNKTIFSANPQYFTIHLDFIGRLNAYMIQDGNNFNQTWWDVPSTGITHYMFIIDLVSSSLPLTLYVNGALYAPIGFGATIISPGSRFVSAGKIGTSSYGSGALNSNMYDFSLLNYALLKVKYTDQQIADYVFNNSRENGSYAFIYQYGSLGAKVEGLFEYRYLDSNQEAQMQQITVSSGIVYKEWDLSPLTIHSGMSEGLCQFTTFNDKLLIVNGKDYPLWYNGATGNFYEMGAPEANQGSVGGVLNGTYTYALSYTTAAGDDVIGTVSNAITVNGRKVRLTLPIPYAAATGGMKLYRTIAGGTQLKLLHTFTAPTPLTYEDNDPDSALGANIGVANNEMIKPYFVESLFDCICMSVVDKYPTQCFIGEAGLEVIDPASNFIDLANVASDNTPIVGMEVDYNQLVLGTHRNVILVDPSTSPAGVTFTRSNIGVLNGYSMCRVPANGNFDGGVMFVSTLGDVRLVSGYKNVIPNTVNDISTENMAQVIQGTFPGMVQSASIINSIFYDYKYHLIVGEVMWVFDIRTESWWKYDVRTTNYVSLPTCFGISGGVLYNGQTDGWIERMYSTIDYNGEDVVSSIESGTLTVNDAYKFMNNWQFWLYTSPNTELTIQMILDDDIANAIEATFSVGEGYFSPKTFSHIFYDTGVSTEDYRNFNISRVARWVKFVITCNKGRLYFRGYNPGVEILRNKE